MQGVVKSYDPGTGEGLVVSDTDRSEYSLAPDALVGSAFGMLRQGQRVIFDLDGEGRATALRLGSEVDMGTPGFPQPVAGPSGNNPRHRSGETPMTYVDVSALKEREWDVVHTSYKDALDSIKKAEDGAERRVQLFLAVVSAAGVAIGLVAKSSNSGGHATLWAAFSGAIAVSAIGILTVARVARMQQTAYYFKVRIAQLGKRITDPDSDFRKLLFFDPYSKRWPERPKQGWWPSGGGLIEVTAFTTSLLIGAAWLTLALVHSFPVGWMLLPVPLLVGMAWLGQVARARHILDSKPGWVDDGEPGQPES